MKLRIRDNTLRLRLTRSEVDALGQGETIVEETPFPDGTSLTYELVPGAALIAGQSTSPSGPRITIEVPLAEAATWAGSDVVGFHGEDPAAVGPLQVLIEKDFTCITPREGEEELDTYPNPNAASA